MIHSLLRQEHLNILLRMMEVLYTKSIVVAIGNELQNTRTAVLRWVLEIFISTYTYIELQSKSWYDVDEKPTSVQAQEAAHLIGMFSQSAPRSNLQHETM